MKTNKLFLATCWLFTLMTLCCVLPTNAQRKKNFTVEIGVSHPVNFGETSVEVGKQFGAHIQFSHMLRNSPLSIDWALSYTEYNDTDDQGWTTDKEEMWALSLIPSINYHFHQTKKVDAYAGLGIGASANAPTDGTRECLDGASCDSPSTGQLVILPRIGILIANHLNIGFEYHCVKDNLNRGSFTIGYVF